MPALPQGTVGDVRIPSLAAQSCIRRLRDVYYRCLASRVVHRHVRGRRRPYDDRCVLEQTIIPFILSRLDPRRVLDVGREPYEAFYNEFFVGRELWTIDWQAERASYGAKNHIIDDVANLQAHFSDGYFHFVLMNGVFGWGLNEPQVIERAFAAVHAVLSPGGIFILGWNDTPDLVPIPLNQIAALQAFSRHFFEPLEATDFKCSTCAHVYSFFVRES
jgi:SAM-dependent methyltransferase